MGGTFRRARKEFGLKKASDHFSRSKWSRRNGTRLRSLLADIADFQAFAGEGADILHGYVGDHVSLPAPKPIAVPSIPKKKSKSTIPPKTIHEVVQVAPQDIAHVTLSHHHKRPKVSVEPTAAADRKKETATAQKAAAVRKKETAFFESLTTEELSLRKTHAARQASYLTAMVKLLEGDPSFAPALVRMLARRKHWESLVGSVGRIIWDRKNSK